MRTLFQSTPSVRRTTSSDNNCNATYIISIHALREEDDVFHIVYFIRLEISIHALREEDGLSQHVSFLKDFFRSYKDFTDAHLDTIEILLTKLYKCFGITDKTDCSKLSSESFPILKDLYNLCEDEFMHYDASKKQLYTEEQLQDICLGIHSMCIGAESRYFSGYTNIIDSNFLCFGVKGLMDTNKRPENMGKTS